MLFPTITNIAFIADEYLCVTLSGEGDTRLGHGTDTHTDIHTALTHTTTLHAHYTTCTLHDTHTTLHARGNTLNIRTLYALH